MDLVEGLRGFAAVAAEGSFTRGAARCGQPQPVVSRRIAALEDHLGVRLFHRSSRQVEITTDGRRLLAQAESILTQIDVLEHSFNARPRLVLAVPTDLAPASRAAIRRGLPDREVHFLEALPQDREHAVRTGTADLGVVPADAAAAEITIALGIAYHDRGAGPIHALDQLRGSPHDHTAPPRVLAVLPEADVVSLRQALLTASAAVGLRADQVRFLDDEAEAWTQLHQHDHVVLCTADEAERQRLSWCRLTSDSLARTYQVNGTADIGTPLRRDLVRRIQVGLGALSQVESP